MEPPTAARGSSPHASNEPGDDDAGMGRYVHATTDKSDPRHWRLRRLQQQASLSLLPTVSSEGTAEDAGGFEEDGDDTTVVDEAWVRRAGRLAAEGQPLEDVTHLELQAVDAPLFLGLECLGALLPGLEGLAFSLGSRLPSLRDLGTAIGRTLRSLDVTACGLEGLEGVAALPLLRELHASHNHIRDLGPLCLHDHLEVLDVEGNPLRRLAGLDLLASLPRLHTLTLRGTPLRDAVVRAAATEEEKDERKGEATTVRPSSSGSGEGEPHYRALVAAVLPRLLVLDGRRLSTPLEPPSLPAWLVERAHAALRVEEEQEEKEERQRRRDGREEEAWR